MFFLSPSISFSFLPQLAQSVSFTFSLIFWILHMQDRCSFLAPTEVHIRIIVNWQIEFRINSQLNRTAAFSTCGCVTGTPSKRGVASSKETTGTLVFSTLMSVLLLLSLSRWLTESIAAWKDDGSGTSSGGTYRRINTEIATIVKARSVPTLTCKNKMSQWQSRIS